MIDILEPTGWILLAVGLAVLAFVPLPSKARRAIGGASLGIAALLLLRRLTSDESEPEPPSNGLRTPEDTREQDDESSTSTDREIDRMRNRADSSDTAPGISTERKRELDEFLGERDSDS